MSDPQIVREALRHSNLRDEASLALGRLTEALREANSIARNAALSGSVSGEPYKLIEKLTRLALGTSSTPASPDARDPTTLLPAMESQDPESAPRFDVPERLAIDANGFGWRVYPEFWSMIPTNPDNSPVPEPVTYYVRESSSDSPALDDVEVLRQAIKVWVPDAGTMANMSGVRTNEVDYHDALTALDSLVERLKRAEGRNELHVRVHHNDVARVVELEKALREIAALPFVDGGAHVFVAVAAIAKATITDLDTTKGE